MKFIDVQQQFEKGFGFVSLTVVLSNECFYYIDPFGSLFLSAYDEFWG